MNSNMTILQIVPEPLPTYRSDVAALFGRYLPRLGISCHIVGKSGKGNIDSRSSIFASERRATDQGSRIYRELSYLYLCVQSLITSKRLGVDIIQVRDMVSISMVAMLIAKFYRLPFIYWMSFPMSEDRLQRSRQLMKSGSYLRALILFGKGILEKALLYKIILPLSDHIFVQSEAMRNMVSRYGLPASRMTPVPMGADTEIVSRTSVTRSRPSGWEKMTIFAYLGSLDVQRETDTIVAALAAVRKRHPNTCLLLIGDASVPSETAMLKRRIEELGQQDMVRITGWLSSQEAWNLLAGADVAVSYCPRSPILDVGTPTKLLEYLALGMPVIANDNPDQQHVLQSSQAGILCESNVQGLANAMESFISDPSSALDRARQGPSYIENARSYHVLSKLVASHYYGLQRHLTSRVKILKDTGPS